MTPVVYNCVWHMIFVAILTNLRNTLDHRMNFVILLQWKQRFGP